MANERGTRLPMKLADGLSLDELAEEQRVESGALAPPEDEWRDDDEAAAFLAAIRDEL